MPIPSIPDASLPDYLVGLPSITSFPQLAEIWDRASADFLQALKVAKDSKKAPSQPIDGYFTKLFKSADFYQSLNEVFLNSQIGRDFALRYRKQIIHAEHNSTSLKETKFFLLALKKAQGLHGIRLCPWLIEFTLELNLDVLGAMRMWAIWADIHYGHNMRAGKIRKGGIMLLQAGIIYLHNITQLIPHIDDLSILIDIAEPVLDRLDFVTDSNGNLWIAAFRRGLLREIRSTLANSTPLN